MMVHYLIYVVQKASSKIVHYQIYYIIIIIIIMQIYTAHTMKFLAYNSWIWGSLNNGYKCQPNAQPK